MGNVEQVAKAIAEIEAKGRTNADRLSRIEARFEKLLVAAISVGPKLFIKEPTFFVMWDYSERAESFLESKRAEAKDGK